MGYWQRLRRAVVLSLLSGTLFLGSHSSALAVSYGVHILHPDEIVQVAEGFKEYRLDDEKLYVTIPFTLDDIGRLAEWQRAFEHADEEDIVPIVRITSEYDSEKDAWKVPDRRQMILLVKALSTLKWPQTKRYVVLFNEPNHAKEWGGAVDPASFAQVTTFLADWLHTEDGEYILLPAGTDLAAPNGDQTWDAFRFWRGVFEAKPDYLEHFDAWNSHSYPNPAFIAPPTARGQNTLRGFEYELEFLKSYSDKKWDVYITETGWRETNQNRNRLNSYYQVAHNTIWSNPQVEVVTPFVWRGSPGPFEEFSFLDADAEPTAQWRAYTNLLIEQTRQLLAKKKRITTTQLLGTSFG